MSRYSGRTHSYGQVLRLVRSNVSTRRSVVEHGQYTSIRRCGVLLRSGQLLDRPRQ